MIESVTLTNFQCHAALHVDLSDMTTLLGASDAGKSAILRAILWVATNRPAGDDQTMWGADTRSVSLVVDGCTITRTKGAGVNTYAIDDQTYEAFGQSVPDDVQQLLGFDDEASFQGQHSPAYWLALSGSQLAQSLNKVLDLSTIDVATKRSRAALSQAKAAAAASQGLADNAAADVADWQDAPAFDAAVQDLEQMVDRRQQLAQHGDDLQQAVAEVKQLGDKVRHSAAAQTAWAGVLEKADKLDDIAATITDLQAGLAEILTVKNRMQDRAADIAETQQTLDSIKVCPTCNREL